MIYYLKMRDFILTYDTGIRAGFFSGIFLAVCFWERHRPKRPLTRSPKVRWFNNLLIAFLNVFLLYLIYPLMAVGVAVLGESRGWGILNNVDISYWIKFIFAIALLDFVIYLQHVVFHTVPLLWRFHRMHHTDTDIDVTTGVRFHPVEIILSMGIKMFVIAALGPSPVAVLGFEILLNATSMFNHGNINIPYKLDRFLRLFIVTPDMHRVHHSVKPEETNSNFGFNLPWWDRISGTYRAEPEDGHGGMTIGLKCFRDSIFLKLHWMLIQPFLNDKGSP